MTSEEHVTRFAILLVAGFVAGLLMHGCASDQSKARAAVYVAGQVTVVANAAAAHRAAVDSTWAIERVMTRSQYDAHTGPSRAMLGQVNTVWNLLTIAEKALDIWVGGAGDGAFRAAAACLVIEMRSMLNMFSANGTNVRGLEEAVELMENFSSGECR